MGRFLEADVKSFKIYLRKVSNAQKFTFEEVVIILVVIETCPNSCPLSPLLDNPTNINPLTTDNFFFFLEMLYYHPPPPFKPDCTLESLNYGNRRCK